MLTLSWDFNLLANYSELWISGIWLTLWLSTGVIIFGTLLACLLVTGLKVRIKLLHWLCRAYIDLFRAIPPLVLLGTLYFLLPSLLGGVVLGATTIALIVLSLNLAPFAAECIRAGFESIPTVQYESAKVLGFTGWRLLYYIILPQVVRRILPPLSGQWVTSLKLTSLAATIGVPEIWHVTGVVVTDTSLPIEARLIGAGLYVAIILPCLLGVLYMERQFNVKGFGITNQ